MSRPIKVLAVGAFSIPYIRDNWGDAVKQVFGDHALWVNAYPLIGLKGSSFCMKYLYQLAMREQPNYFFFYHDWIFEAFNDDFFQALRNAGIRLITYYPDDEPGQWLDRNRAYDHRFDIIASHSKNGVAHRKPTLGAHAIHVPWGFNQRFVNRAQNHTPPEFDLVFVGKHKPKNDDDGSYREDGYQRQELLDRLAQFCMESGRTFRLFGYGWDSHPSLNRFSGGLLEFDDMISVYQRARIVFNPAWSWSSGGQKSLPQTKLRHFEVAGAGAFQLTNHNPELAELFEEDKEIVFFRDQDDLIRKIDIFLGDDGRRQSIAEAGFLRAHRDHTLFHRITDLFEKAEKAFCTSSTSELASASSVRHPQRCTDWSKRVKQISFRSREDMKSYRDRVHEDEALLGDAAWFHFHGTSGSPRHVDYSLIASFLDTDTSIIGVRTYLDIERALKNHVQPTMSDIQGGVLDEEACWEKFDEYGDLIREQLLLIDDRWRFYPLCNYICHRSRVVEYLDAFIDNRAEGLRHLRTENSGAIINELSLESPSVGIKQTSQEIPNPPYIRKARSLLSKSARRDHRVVIYGARGFMAEHLLQLVKQIDKLNVVAIVDNGMAGRTLDGIPIVTLFELPKLEPDLVVIAAAYSGPSIYSGIRSLEGRTTIVPLFDLQDPIWDILLP